MWIAVMQNHRTLILKSSTYKGVTKKIEEECNRIKKEFPRAVSLGILTTYSVHIYQCSREYKFRGKI